MILVNGVIGGLTKATSANKRSTPSVLAQLVFKQQLDLGSKDMDWFGFPTMGCFSIAPRGCSIFPIVDIFKLVWIRPAESEIVGLDSTLKPTLWSFPCLRHG